MEFGFEIGFTDHFNTQLLFTINYSAITNLHTLEITRAQRPVFSVCYSPTSRFLVTDLNNEDSSASVLTLLLSSEYPTTVNSCSNCHLGTDHVQKTVSNSSSIVVHGFVAMGTCLFVKVLLSNGCIYLLIKNLMPSSRCCFLVCFAVVTQ
jgi:hypothetical protein